MLSELKKEPLYIRAARLRRMGFTLSDIAKIIYGSHKYRYRAWALIRYARRKGISTECRRFSPLFEENGEELKLDAGFEPRSTLWEHHADPAERLAAGEDRQLIEHERLLFEIYKLLDLSKYDKGMIIWVAMKAALYRTFPKFKEVMKKKVWFHKSQATYPVQNLAYLYLVVLSSLIWTPFRWRIEDLNRVFSFFLKRKYLVDFMQWKEQLIPLFTNEFAPFKYIEAG